MRGLDSARHAIASPEVSPSGVNIVGLGIDASHLVSWCDRPGRLRLEVFRLSAVPDNVGVYVMGFG